MSTKAKRRGVPLKALVRQELAAGRSISVVYKTERPTAILYATCDGRIVPTTTRRGDRPWWRSHGRKGKG